MNIEIILIAIIIIFILCWIKYDEIVDYMENMHNLNERYDNNNDTKSSKDLDSEDYKNINLQSKPQEYNYQLYLDYLKSSDWLSKKVYRFLIDKGQCQECNKLLLFKESHCHHKTYDNLFDEPMEDLETLCKHCHLEIRHADKCSNI